MPPTIDVDGVADAVGRDEFGLLNSKGAQAPVPEAREGPAEPSGEATDDPQEQGQRDRRDQAVDPRPRQRPWLIAQAFGANRRVSMSRANCVANRHPGNPDARGVSLRDDHEEPRADPQFRRAVGLGHGHRQVPQASVVHDLFQPPADAFGPELRGVGARAGRNPEDGLPPEHHGRGRLGLWHGFGIGRQRGLRCLRLAGLRGQRGDRRDRQRRRYGGCDEPTNLPGHSPSLTSPCEVPAVETGALAASFPWERPH